MNINYYAAKQQPRARREPLRGAIKGLRPSDPVCNKISMKYNECGHLHPNYLILEKHDERISD